MTQPDSRVRSPSQSTDIRKAGKSATCSTRARGCVEAELADVDDFLDVLTTPSLPVSALAATVAASEPVSGTKPITILLHNRVINAFKDEASRTGANYQTLMHRALADATEEFAL